MAAADSPTVSRPTSRLRYLRLRSFDVSSAEGRSAERYRLAIFGALANAVSRVAGMLLMVLTVHWATPYLGAERFGVWATFASLAAMLSFLDLGVGNALVNRVAHAAAEDDPFRLRRLVTGGVGWLALIGAAATALLAAAASVIPWGGLFKLSDAATSDEARRAALTFSVLFGLNVVSSGLLKILVGQQRSHEAHLISGCGAIAACATLWLATGHRAGVPELLLVGFGVQTVAGFAVLPLLQRRSLLVLRNITSNMRAERGVLLKTGSLFLILQVGTMIGWGSDSLLLAGFAGASEVAAFAVVQRLFMFASQPVAVLNAPLWAAYADGLARDDRGFLRQTLRRSALWSVIGGAALSLALATVGPWMIPLWTQGAVQVPWILLALFAAWTMLEVGGIAFGTYLNGAGIVREQVAVVLIFCAVALPLKIFAVANAGAPGLVAATIVAYLFIVVGLYSTVYRQKILSPLKEPKS